MKGQYQEEKDGEGTSKKDVHDISVGRGTKGPSLHGKHTLEDKRDLPDNEANKVDAEGDLGLAVRKAVTLDYLHGGGDGKGDDVMERLAEHKAMNPELIDHKEVDELYPR